MKVNKFISLGGLAQRAGISRNVVSRLLVQKIIKPEAVLLVGELEQPLFLPEISIDVVRAVRPLKNLPAVIGDVRTLTPMN